MAQNTSDFLVKRLIDWGIHRVFGYPGDGINGVMGALNRADGEIQFIQTRHEELAAFMACAHAKFTGQVGVCMATSGPGAIHLLNGLYDAKKDHQPVVAIVGPAGEFSRSVPTFSRKSISPRSSRMSATTSAWSRTAPASGTALTLPCGSPRPSARRRDGGDSERHSGGTLRGAAAQARQQLHGHRLFRPAHRPRAEGDLRRGPPMC